MEVHDPSFGGDPLRRSAVMKLILMDLNHHCVEGVMSHLSNCFPNNLCTPLFFIIFYHSQLLLCEPENHLSSSHPAARLVNEVWILTGNKPGKNHHGGHAPTVTLLHLTCMCQESNVESVWKRVVISFFL